MISFVNYIKNFWPNIWARDTNKDSNDKGTFERYLQVFGDEIDNELIPYIDDDESLFDEFNPVLNNFLDIIDGFACNNKFLNHLAEVLGNPPDVFQKSANDYYEYRALIRYIITVYKWRGSLTGFELFYRILGYDIWISEIAGTTNLYDSGLTYDDGESYDVNESILEGNYNIQFAYIDDGVTSVPGGELTSLELTLPFIEPINTTFNNVTSKY